jgi:hypothetical protein
MNLVVALLAGVISITGGIYSLKSNIFAGPAYGNLQGIVRDERIAKPLKLASVEISDLSGAVVNTATTDDDGYYLIKAVKTGNYVVKFTAPLHKIETKTIKIEKDLAPSINVDLFPEAQQANLFAVESAAPVRQNIQVPYVPVTPVSSYSGSQNTTPASTASSAYSQTGPAQEPAAFSPPRTGFRRHSRRSYSGESAETLSGSFFTAEENQTRQRVVLLGQTVQKTIFGDEEPLGQTIKINRVSFQVLGILLAAVVSWLIAALAQWKMVITLGSLFLAFLFSAGVGILFGLWPAKQAAELDPIRALRYE